MGTDVSGLPAGSAGLSVTHNRPLAFLAANADSLQGAAGAFAAVPAATNATLNATTPSAAPATDYYASVLTQTLTFYDTQRSGRLPSSIHQAFPMMMDSALDDGKDVGLDLVGGYFDSGTSVVKYTLPLAFSLTTLAWGAIEFPEGFAAANQTAHLLDTVKWGTDYLMNCVPNSTALVVQVASKERASAWNNPANIASYNLRATFTAGTQLPASDAAGETSAALAAASILFRTVNETSALPQPPPIDHSSDSNQLLAKAKTAFEYADTYRGLAYKNIPPENGAFVYSPWGYLDDLAWGAAWLHKATNGTGHFSWIPDYRFNWDMKDRGVDVLMATTLSDGMSSLYGSRVKGMFANISYPGDEYSFFSQGGLLIRDLALQQDYDFVSAPDSINVAFLGYIVSKYNAKANSDLATIASEFATAQLNYVLGDNPSNFTFITGIDSRSPINPCSMLMHGGINISYPVNNKYVLPGALVGGPTVRDKYVDTRLNRLYTEPKLICR
ncbi:Six-hairpin glycosidase-like protein [Zopfochytrium polystomum]|nr:Six-hairpin glycosidase-like protein [Zopfochytrium polystomum]